MRPNSLAPFAGLAVCSGGVPDRRGVGAILHRHQHLRWHCDPEPLRVVGRPAWRRYLDDAYVIKRALLWIKIRVLPVRMQKWFSDRVGVAGIGKVHSAANRCVATAIFDRSIVGTGNVVYAFLRAAISIKPPLNDLNAIKIGAIWIAQGADHELW